MKINIDYEKIYLSYYSVGKNNKCEIYTVSIKTKNYVDIDKLNESDIVVLSFIKDFEIINETGFFRASTLITNGSITIITDKQDNSEQFNFYNEQSGKCSNSVFITNVYTIKQMKSNRKNVYDFYTISFKEKIFSYKENSISNGEYKKNRFNELITDVQCPIINDDIKRTLIIIPSIYYHNLTHCIFSMKMNINSKCDILIAHKNYNYLSKYCEMLGFLDYKYNYEYNYSRIHNEIILGEIGKKYDYFILCNDDIEFIKFGYNIRNFLSCMSFNNNIGVVGSKLLYEDGTIQHAGVRLNKNFMPEHAFRRQQRYDIDCNNTKYILAVTFALVCIRKSVYKFLGGMDEKLPCEFQDIKFCLECNMNGFNVLYNSDIEAFHFESYTRHRIGNINVREDYKLFSEWVTKNKYKFTGELNV
jgi:hypothetical protein